MHPVAIQVPSQNRSLRFDGSDNYMVGMYYDLVSGECIKPGLVILHQDMLVQGNIPCMRCAWWIAPKDHWYEHSAIGGPGGGIWFIEERFRSL